MSNIGKLVPVAMPGRDDEATDILMQEYVCPGQVNYSRRKFDEYSDDSQIYIGDIFTELGDD